MKTTVEIPDDELADVVRHTGARTKKEAVSMAVAEYNRRHRMAKLAVELRGSCQSMMTAVDLQSQRATRQG